MEIKGSEIRFDCGYSEKPGTRYLVDENIYSVNINNVSYIEYVTCLDIDESCKYNIYDFSVFFIGSGTGIRLGYKNKKEAIEMYGKLNKEIEKQNENTLSRR